MPHALTHKMHDTIRFAKFKSELKQLACCNLNNVQAGVEGLLIEHLELDEVDVDRMRIGGEVDHLPDLHRSHGRSLCHRIGPGPVAQCGLNGVAIGVIILHQSKFPVVQRMC